MNNGYDKIQAETAETLAGNPFIDHFYYRQSYYEEIPKLGILIEKLKENESFSKSEILFAMFEYARIYEQFRPDRITNNDAYFGTVNKMDGIYFTLFKYLDADLLLTFSRSSVTDLNIQFKKASKIAHKDVCWEEMIGDIKDVDRAILITMEKHAVALYCILRDNTPFHIMDLVEGFIIRRSDNIKKEEINFRDGFIFIKNKKLIIEKPSQLFNAVFEMDKQLKSVNKNQ